MEKLSMVFSPGQAPTCYETGSAVVQRINGNTPRTLLSLVFSLIIAYTHAQTQQNTPP